MNDPKTVKKSGSCKSKPSCNMTRNLTDFDDGVCARVARLTDVAPMVVVCLVDEAVIRVAGSRMTRVENSVLDQLTW